MCTLAWMDQARRSRWMSRGRHAREEAERSTGPLLVGSSCNMLFWHVWKTYVRRDAACSTCTLGHNYNMLQVDREIFSKSRAFIAKLPEGRVVTWGDSDCINVRTALQLCHNICVSAGSAAQDVDPIYYNSTFRATMPSPPSWQTGVS